MVVADKPLAPASEQVRPRPEEKVSVNFAVTLPSRSLLRLHLRPLLTSCLCLTSSGESLRRQVALSFLYSPPSRLDHVSPRYCFRCVSLDIHVGSSVDEKLGFGDEVQ